MTSKWSIYAPWLRAQNHTTPKSQTPQDLGPVSEKSLLRRVPSQVTVIGDTFSVVRRSAKKPKKWRKTVARINVAKMLCGRVLQRSCAETGSHAGQIRQDSRFLSDEI